MYRLLHYSYFREIKLGSELLPNDMPKEMVYADNPKHFSLLYKYKLSNYLTRFPIAEETDFINENLKGCDEMIAECKRFKDNLLDSGDRSFTDDGMDYEILLIKKWKEFLKACKTNIQKAVKAEVVIATLKLKQSILDVEDKESIRSNIKLLIYGNFEYFKKEYGEKCDWDSALYSIYHDITGYYYQIGNTKEVPQIKLLHTNLRIYQVALKRQFQSFERFFEYLIYKNRPDDCLMFLNFIRRSIVDYNEMLNQSGYNFSRSYFYDTINECYADMETKYNAQRLKLITINNIAVENAKNGSKKTENEVHPLTFESMFHKKEYASIALQVLKDIDPPILDSNGHYIGKSKGVFKVWIDEMRKHKPCLIVPLPDMRYRNILNDNIQGLKLSKDASELRKPYKTIDTIFRLNLASLLSDIFKSSQSSQSSQNY